MKKLILSLFLLAAFSARAEGPFVGTITQSDTNADFYMVVLNGGAAPLCTGGPGWAIINKTDPNYRAYVSELIVARRTGSTVNLYTTLASPHCAILYLSVR